MEKIKTVILADESEVEYMIPDTLSKKEGPFRSKDGKQTLLFFTTKEPDRRRRLEAVSERCNFIKAKSDTDAAFLEAHILWPRAVLEPRLGALWPMVPENFRFGAHSAPYRELSAVRKGQERKSIWFLSQAGRDTLTPEEQGDGRKILDAMIMLARIMTFLHKNGFAFPGFSDESVLLDLIRGDALIVMDTDGFALLDCPLPRTSRPPKYAAPELSCADRLEVAAVRERLEADQNVLEKMQEADRHALAVLFYQLLFLRHPLEYPKSSHATPEDPSESRPRFLGVPDDPDRRAEESEYSARDLGQALKHLFLQTFEEGLYCPRERPTASLWQRVLEEIRQSQFRALEAKTSRKTHSARLLWIECGWEMPASSTGKNGQDDENRQSEFEIDISAFLMGENKRTCKQNDMVYFQSPRHRSLSVELLERPVGTDTSVKRQMTVEETRIPPEIARIDFVATVYYTGAESERCFQEAKNAFLHIRDDTGDIPKLEVWLNEECGDCSACIAASLIRQEGGEWQLRRIGTGQNGSLAGVCAHYNVQVEKV